MDRQDASSQGDCILSVHWYIIPLERPKQPRANTQKYINIALGWKRSRPVAGAAVLYCVRTQTFLANVGLKWHAELIRLGWHKRLSH